MLRLFLALGLLLSFFLLGGSMIATWREDPAPAAVETEKTPPRPVTDRKKTDFYPPVPGRLPDLHKGYLFNEARSLADENGEGEGAAPVVDTTLDEATYIGSVISGQRRIGIVSYQEKNAVPQARASFRGRPLMGAAPAGESKHVQLVPGESFGGYTVAEVLPDRIVFEKNGRSMEKLLNVEKERKPPPPLQGARRAQPQGSQTRVIVPRQVEQAGRMPPVIGSPPGRPPSAPEPPPPPQPIAPPPPPPSPPGTVIQGSPPQVMPAVPGW